MKCAFMAKILHLIGQLKRFDDVDYPMPIVRIADDPRYKKALKGLQQKLKSIAPPDLAAEVIASKRGLENLMKWCWLDNQDPTQLPELLVGWRREFGLVLLNTLANG